MYQHFRYNCRTFYNTAIRCDITFEDCKSTRLAVWIVDWTDYFRIFVFASCDIFSNCLSGYCHAVCVKKTFLIQLVHNSIYTTRFIQVFHICRTCRCKVTEVRSLFADSVCKINLKIHTDLMCDRRKVKHTVG